MNIERLILQGFKSFGERTSLEFGPGIYGIVGPNGSGKSNLVEALRWVVGARARELRGEEALSLLFHGSEGKAPLGFAEVGLELGGNGKRVSLSRRLERDGNSEVRLNGARSTLRQVEQALMGTGLSRTGYAIVGQGEVGQILQAGPEVLLSYLEEAAGLRAVTQASKTAHERLESATLELQARTQELSERKASVLEKAQQAETARKAATLAARSLVLRRSVLAARIREADQEVKTARHKAQALEQERSEASRRLHELEIEKSQALEALEAAQNAHSEALRQAEALSGEVRLVEQERASLEGLLRRLGQDLGESEARLTRLRALPEPVLPSEPEPNPEVVQGYQQRLQALQAQIQTEEHQLKAQQQAFERYLQAQATYEAQKLAYEQMRAQQAALEAEQARLEGELAHLQQQLTAAQARESELRARLNALVKQEGQIHSEARAALSEARRLEAMLRSGSDLAEGPKRAREAGIPGLIGVVADLLQVPTGLELAIEVAMGGRMQWVLTEHEQAAQAAVQYLKQQGGRATFLPRTLLRTVREGERDWSREPGVVGVARQLVQLPACPEALPTLLGQTLVVETLEAALNLVRKHPNPPRLVTLEGELLETSGAITGGRLQKGGQMLALRRRYQETQAEAARLEAEAQALAAQTEQLRVELAGLEVPDLLRRQTELGSELKAVQASLSRLSQSPAPQAPAPVAPPQPEGLQTLRNERETLNAQVAQAREAAAQWRRYREDLERYKQAQQEIEALEIRLHRLRTEQGELEHKLTALQARKAELEQARQSLNLRHLEGALQTARGRTRALSEEETRLIGRTNALLSDLEALHLIQARREATIETLQQELAELPPGPVEEGSSRSLARALSETEAALEALGPINHLAEQEYALLAEDIQKLEVALQEAEAVVRKLEAELQLVQSEYRERMHQVYDIFKEKFAHYASALLDAEVELARSNHGLELVLRPAGKRTVNLNLLSMGERTMGALAFLFALSEVGEGSGGLPIAVLDEVDAPLDEANIQRFCRFLRHFKGQTQFILVTHQKRTMEACDALYGVTTERGLSRVYSIKQAEVPA
ncbi:AAA family ATPase [Meiothermus sp.]|uniref:AAA family ATPase n=1 Tax=Meiothermus sp. TaxID=1955249 RepID=UPI0021DE927F|nr:AAA family ATPase [Meiothermus sp.]GIW24265.1 MAG: chromosome partitioning protein Smc [Meiothermus sp.]